MKRYTIQVVIEEGSDEFWESLSGTGVEDVVGIVTDAIADRGFQHDATVKLIKFEDD